MKFIVNDIIANVDHEQGRTFHCDYYDKPNGRRCSKELDFDFTMTKNGEWKLKSFYYLSCEDTYSDRSWTSKDMLDFITNWTYCSKESLEEIMKNVHEHYEEIVQGI